MRRILGLLTLTFSLVAWQINDEPPKPNVVLIMTDDQGWGDLSIHKNAYVETPNIDQLAREGGQVEHFHVSPLCAATRASILTGRYHLRTGVVSVSGGLEAMRSDETTLAEVFKQNGYTTGCFGKWHNGEHYPEDAIGQGFDEFYGFKGGHLNNYFNPTLEFRGQTVNPYGFVTDVLTDAAMMFMNNNRHQPFFCYIPYNAPHSPYQVPDKYYQKYRAKGVNPELATVYGMIENVDDNVGRIMQNLKTLGIDRNTIVIFMSDNGPNGLRFNGMMKGIKGSTDEGGVRVPFFVRWVDKIFPNTFVKGLSAHVDILPTLVELCGLKFTPPKPIDGLSIAPNLLYNKPIDKQRSVFTHVTGWAAGVPNAVPAAVRNDHYRLVMTKDSTRLYDITTDPYQKRPLTNEKTALQLKTDYDAWFADVTKGLEQPRYIPLGHDLSPKIELQAPWAKLSKRLRFKRANGWANDWITNWRSVQDTISWNVDVATTTTYQVQMKYTCQLSRVGSVIGVGVGKNMIASTLQKVFDPPILTLPDRIPRKEAYDKRWGLLNIGTITLPAGKHKLWLRAIHVSVDEAAEFKSLVLTKI